MSGLFSRLTRRATRFDSRRAAVDPFAGADEEGDRVVVAPPAVPPYPAPTGRTVERILNSESKPPVGSSRPRSRQTEIIRPDSGPLAPITGTGPSPIAASLRREPTRTETPQQPERRPAGTDRDGETRSVTGRPAVYVHVERPQQPAGPNLPSEERHAVDATPKLAVDGPAPPASPRLTSPGDLHQTRLAHPARGPAAEPATAVPGTRQTHRANAASPPARQERTPITAPPEVHIRIDRIDVVAPTAPPTPAPVPVSTPASSILSLADFLRGGEATG